MDRLSQRDWAHRAAPRGKRLGKEGRIQSPESSTPSADSAKNSKSEVGMHLRCVRQDLGWPVSFNP